MESEDRIGRDGRVISTFWGYMTSSSAVAERPRDALCPSVVSLNKIITCAESFSISEQLTLNSPGDKPR